MINLHKTTCVKCPENGSFIDINDCRVCCENYISETNTCIECELSVNKLKCWRCGKEFEHELSGEYPTGPCPIDCPDCDAYCCPVCGGKMGYATGDDDLDLYTSGGCHQCDYTCCGGCV